MYSSHVRAAHSTLLIAALALLAMPPALEAQTPPPPRQKGTAELAFVGTTGNTSTSTLSAGAEHIIRPEGWLVRNRVSFIRGRVNGVVTAQSFLYAVRVEREMTERLSAIGDYGYFRDEPAGVSSRNAVTGGLAFKIATGPTHTFTVDGGLGYLNEQRVAGAEVSSAAYTGGALYKLKLSDTADLTDEMRLHGTFDDADDWRGAHTIALTARLTTLLSLSVSNVVRYANFPPPGFKRTDTTTAVALVASFKRQ
jgi:putative salt-induced outer membrane protein